MSVPRSAVRTDSFGGQSNLIVIGVPVDTVDRRQFNAICRSMKLFYSKNWRVGRCRQPWLSFTMNRDCANWLSERCARLASTQSGSMIQWRRWMRSRRIPRVRVLVTRMNFGAGKLNGVALARMLMVKRPCVKTVFVAQPENEEHADGVGEFLPSPMDPLHLTDVVARLLMVRIEAAGAAL